MCRLVGGLDPVLQSHNQDFKLWPIFKTHVYSIHPSLPPWHPLYSKPSVSHACNITTLLNISLLAYSKSLAFAVQVTSSLLSLKYSAILPFPYPLTFTQLDFIFSRLHQEHYASECLYQLSLMTGTTVRRLCSREAPILLSMVVSPISMPPISYFLDYQHLTCYLHHFATSPYLL